MTTVIMARTFFLSAIELRRLAQCIDFQTDIAIEQTLNTGLV